MPDWTWDTESKRYRSKTTGQYLSASNSVDLRDDFQQRQRAELTRLADGLAAEELTVQQWEARMRTAVRQIHATEYALGRGGVNAMTAADDAALRALVADQWAYLHAFAEDVRAGLLSPAQVRARAHQYAASSRQAYERGRAGSWNVVPPHVPADGSTPCGANCKCYITYRETDTTVELRWRLQSGESCSGCKARAVSWSPLVLAKPSDGRSARLYRAVA